MKGTVFERKQKPLYKKVYKCRKQKKRYKYDIFAVRVGTQNSPKSQRSFFTNFVKLWKNMFEGSVKETDNQDLKMHTAAVLPFRWGSGTPLGQLCM